MAITLDGLARPKTSPNSTLSLTLKQGTTTEFDAVGDGKEGFFTPYHIDSLAPTAFTVGACSRTTGSPQITTTNNGFANVKVGDPISGAGIPANATVTVKTDANTITISAAATSTTVGVLNFDPIELDPALFGIGVDIVKSGTSVVIKLFAYKYDGTLGVAGANESNASDTIELGSFTMDIDTFLSNYRVPRSN